MSSRQPAPGGSSSGSQTWIGNAALKKLCTLLRNEGDRVLSGSSSFTLTTEVLAQLNTDCRRHSIVENDATLTAPSERNSFLPLTNAMRSQQAANKVRAEWSNHIQFIKDFMLSAPNLKIIHNSGTLSSPLSLHRFGNVSCLQLRKVPIHMVEGLQKLRSSLTSLTVCRCLDTVKDLLEYCGGDMSAPMTWPELKFVCLMFNSLTSLDDSLRLLPHVEVLDLSHNSLETCNSYLEYLCDIVFLNLAYNTLTHVPSFSLTTRASLTSLILRGNNLDSVKGIDELLALQELDLGENCLSDHSWLEPLSALTRLRQLQLDGNPIYYHRLHRPLTVSCLARQAITVQFELDKKKLSMSEITYFPPRKTQYSKTTGRHPYVPRSIPEMRGNIQVRDDGMSPSSGIGTENDSSTDILASPSSRKKSKRKKLKARHTEILDMDVSGECSSSRDPTPGSSPAMKSFEEMRKARRDEARKTKKEIEELRKHYGPNWLQAIEDRNIFNVKKTEAEGASSPGTSDSEKLSKSKITKSSKNSGDSDSQPDTKASATPSMKSDSDRDNAPVESSNGPTEDDLLLRDTRQSEANNPIMAAIARMASGQSASETDGERDGGVYTFPSFGSSYSKSDSNTTEAAMMLPLTDDDSQTSSNHGDPAASSVLKNQQPLEKKSTATSALTIQQSLMKTGYKGSESGIEISNQNQGTHQNSSSCLSSITTSNLLSNTNTDLQRESRLSKDLKEKNAPSREDLSAVENSPMKKSDRVMQTSISSGSDIISSDMDSSMEKSLILVEEEAVTESMFVSLPLQDNKMIIMTLTESFLVEKDVRGKVTEKLELSCLTSMEHKQTKTKKTTKDYDNNVADGPSGSKSGGEAGDSSEGKKGKNKEVMDEGIDSIQIDLKLDYVKKDRQRRCYVVDKADGKIIMDHLQPFLDIREEEAKAKLNIAMQCLKCNRTFLKGEVLHKSKQLPTSGSSKDLQSLQELMGTPTLVCPKCGSTIIIELESATTVKSTNSTTSTPAGSYNSTGSYMEQAKKPAPLLKRKSFDHASPQAGLAARIRTRKNSTDSLDLSAAKQGGQSGSVTPVGGSPGNSMRDINGHSRSSSLTNWRDRSNAFVAPNKMSRSLMVNTTEQSVDEKDELVCVEDYFSKEASSSFSSSKELAAMTTSLRADATTKGRKAFVKRQPLSNEESKGQSSNSRQMFDSGFESQIENVANESTRPISIEGNAIDTHVRASRVGSVVSADGQRWEDSDDNRSRSSSKVSSTHRHLATMEDIVNAIVSEGKNLEEQAVLSGSLNSLNSRSVSISTFRKSSISQSQPRHSVSSIEADGAAGLHRSESNSSITVLPTPVLEDSSSVMAQSASALSSNPVTFSIGTPDAPKAENSSVKEQERVVSPLSSNICSSMVSSVYENSVNTPPEANSDDDDVHVIGSGDTVTDTDRVKGIESNTDSLAATVIGSTESRNSSSSEDLTSIYDRPRKPSKSTKMSGSRFKSKSDNPASLTSDQPDIYHQNDFMDNGGTQNVVNDSVLGGEFESSRSSECRELENPPATSPRDIAALAGFGDSDKSDESDENDEQDVTPQYAFHHLNHRLTLYMMMSLFGNDEEFLCKMQSEVVQYIVEESFEGILVMSSVRFYILKITSKDHSQEPDQWLKCIEIQPIPELRYIDVGLGGQSIRLEFVTDCSSYTLVTRNRDKTAQFVEVLHTQLAKYAVSQGITSHVVVNEDVDQLTLDNLDADVVSKVKPHQKLMLYCMGYIERGNEKLFPMSFVITSSDICLVRTNHQWPQPRLQAPITVDTVGKQFTVLERQKVNNVASVEVCEATMKKIRLELFNEMEGIATNWNITMATRQSTVDFINALSEPWAQEFGVEMDITYAELDF